MLNKKAASFGIAARYLANYPAVKEFMESYNISRIHKKKLWLIVYEIWGAEEIINPLVDNDIARGYREIPQDFKNFIKERYDIDIETPTIFVKSQIDDSLKEMALAREWRKIYLSATGHPMADEHQGWENWQQTFLTEWTGIPKDEAEKLLFDEYTGTEKTEQELVESLPQFPEMEKDNEE